ncbi:MAG: hypothetical protein KJ899_15475 [Gammaproteobacteria bacterium]|nr:hypothetical protein [Gammaproteobacteria bacterium]
MPDFNEPLLATPDAEALPVSISVDGADLHKQILRDIDDRKSWVDKQRSYRKSRLGEKKRIKLPYPGAPNLVEPLIDDNVCALTSAENSILWSARVLATFLPLDSEAYQYKALAERGFDTLLRITLDVRAKLENLFDTKNERSMAVAKLVVNDTAMPGELLPDFDTIDPIDVVVPRGTKRIRDADRVTHILRYTDREFCQEAQRRNWLRYNELLEALSQDTNQAKAGSNALPDADEYGVTRSRWNLETDDNSEREICIWEVYHWRILPDKTTEKRVTIICPDKPEIILDDREWKWPDEEQNIVDQATGMVVLILKTGDPRPWPFIQFRYENRSLYYHDVRGVAEKLEDSQKEATANKNAKALVMDYTCKPFIKGDRNIFTSFKFRPGDILPPGAELVIPPRVDPIFDYNMDLARAAAARRVGAPHGSFSSVDKTREAKTATEVSQTALTSNMLSSDAVERFCEPLGELFNQMWDFMRHNPPGGLVAVTGDNVELVPAETYSMKFMIIPGVSGRSANPELILRQLTVIAQLLQAFPQVGQFIRGDAMAQFIFDQIDPKLTPHLVVAGNGMAPIEQQVAMLGQVLFGAQGKPGVIQQHQANTNLLAAMAQEQQFVENTQDPTAAQENKVMNRAPAQYNRKVAGNVATP